MRAAPGNRYSSGRADIYPDSSRRARLILLVSIMRKLFRVFVFMVVLGLVTGCGDQAQDKMANLEEITIDELQASMAGGEITARQLAQAYMARIEQFDARLNAVIELNPDALRIADKLDEERAAGRVLSPLHGIPVLLKDNIDTADKMLTTAGSLALVNAPVPESDATFVKHLREAGVVILGKTNLSEWANFRSNRSSSGWSARGGQTRNPYVLDRTPCGSSSGSAVAVAANLTAVAVGTETDGSIICPAANNGIVGIKPTVGLISGDGIVPISHSQDTAGPMARTVTDAARLLTVMATAPEAENYAGFLKDNGLEGKRIGVMRQYFGRNAEVDALMESNLKILEAGGATLVDVEVPTLKAFAEYEIEVLLYEFKHGLNVYLGERGGEHRSLADLIEFNRANDEKEMRYFGQDLFERAQRKGDLDSEEYLNALKMSRELTRDRGVDAVMAEHKLDALLAPSNGTAWMIDLISGDSGKNYVSSSGLAAAAGYPAITVPAGFIKELPIGISFFASAYAEATLIEIAYDFEQRSRARQVPQMLPTWK